MKCILMNQNTEVLVVDYDEGIKGFRDILEIKNIDYAPLIVKKAYEKKENMRLILNNWFKGRGIPTFRDQLDLLLSRLSLSAPEELLDKAFALSLSDQYWIKPENRNIQYEDINFFDHDFDSVDFLDASFSNTSKEYVSEDALKTPNNTTDGMLKKSWIIENHKRYLLKGGYKNEILQPFNEVLASWICERLGFDHVTYSLDMVNGKVVSKCECFIQKDTEFIPAHQMMYGKEKTHSIQDYEEYIRILESHGIEKAREKLENMYILDFLIMNEDRHLNNFGVIRDVRTLEWLDVAPIFDNGQSFNVISYNNEELAILGEGRFFYTMKKFEDMIKVVRNIQRIDVSKLDGIVEEFDDLLHQYQDFTHLSDDRIHKLCILLNRQIQHLTHFQASKLER